MINKRFLYFCFWLLLVLAGCQRAVEDVRTAVPLNWPAAIEPPYGLVYALDTGDWQEADRADIRKRLSTLQALGVNTVVQTFSSDLVVEARETDWLIFLDEAEQADMRVVARLWPLTDTEDDWEVIARFLDVVDEHPAFYAYLGLHEPLERFNSTEMRAFYEQFKTLAPQTPLAHYMGNMALFDGSLRFPGRTFSAGICDICIVWATPAQQRGETPVFDGTAVTDAVAANRSLLDERDVHARLWFLGQSYALTSHNDNLRMPTPAEMEKTYVLAMAAGADGFLWYPWLHGNYDAVLSEPEWAAQQKAVYDIYAQYVAPSDAP